MRRLPRIECLQSCRVRYRRGQRESLWGTPHDGTRPPQRRQELDASKERPTAVSKDSDTHGLPAFLSYYEALYPDRWPSLLKALGEDPAYVTLQDGLRSPYHLDAASVAAAMALPIPPDASVLDMCAAPGGKTIVLARRLDHSSRLVANERSGARRNRLRHVLDAHLPRDTRSKIEITGHDARKWGLHETDAYDAVLCDVPCSSERHLLFSPKESAKWSRSRIRSLAVQAVAFLAAACDATVGGGRVLYSTCSLTNDENDAVVRRVLLRRSQMSVVNLLTLPRPHMAETTGTSLPVGEATEFGRHFLPDTAGGAGPLYFALLAKEP